MPSIIEQSVSQNGEQSVPIALSLYYNLKWTCHWLHHLIEIHTLWIDRSMIGQIPKRVPVSQSAIDDDDDDAVSGECE